MMGSPSFASPASRTGRGLVRATTVAPAAAAGATVVARTRPRPARLAGEANEGEPIMKSRPERKWPLPEHACELVDYLYIEDERTNGAPALSGERLGLARDWLVRVVFDRTDRLAHVEELQRCYSRSRRPSQGDSSRGTIF